MPQHYKYVMLEGETVKLRPILASDAAVAYSMLVDEQILAWLLWDGPESEGEVFNTYSQWEKQFGASGEYWFALERLDEPGLIGCISFSFPQHEKQTDVGYWLGKPFWNRGYMTEAVRLVCYLCFEHLGSERMYAPVFKGNVRSRRTLEKNGFILDGTLRRHLLKRGQWLDVWFMSLIRQDWQQKKPFYQPEKELLE